MAETIQLIAEPVPIAVRDEFEYRASAWENSVFLTMDEMFSDEDYQQIIEMGPQVVPLILRRIQTRPNWWSPALIRLTGVDPTAVQERGSLAAETKAWLEWAAQQGHLTSKSPR